MAITVTCPSCSSSFPVDPAKIPPKGVSARCSKCGDVFRIEKPSATIVPPPRPAEPAPLPPPPPPVAKPAPFFEESASLDDVEVVPPPRVPAPRGPAVAPPPPTPDPTAPDTGFRFGKRDPTDKAKRLARVLVSDMIMYNADRHVSALENGTLMEDFEEEIDKSWKEFVEQVGPEIADGPGRGFWTDALNDILAKGKQLF
jgi:predicted Zn finger-like uncharacterized protein